MLELKRRRADLSQEHDQVLMERMRGDDEAALDALIQRYWGPLVGYAAGFVKRQDEAEDIVQEGFIRVWSYRANWVAEGSVRGFVYTVVRNLCLHERDRRRVRREWAAGEQRRQRMSPTPAQVLEEREILRELEAAIDRLPERRREVFTLACLHGLSYREIAEAMGIAVPTVANQMSAALTEVRQALRPVTDEVN